jgi:ActR/RegA family two-component response regulator
MLTTPSSSLGSFFSPDSGRLNEQLRANNAGFESSPGDTRGANRVLWIDDEVQPTDALVRLIQQEGFQVDCAPTGDLGLDLARRYFYQAIVLDLRLAGSSGLEVLRRLRESGVACPVVMLTGFAEVASAVAAMKLGAVDYREKPIDADDLAALLRAVCASPFAAPDRTSGDGWLQSKIDDLAICTTWTDLVGVILGALRDQRLSLRAFLGCAEALRLLFLAEPSTLS